AVAAVPDRTGRRPDEPGGVRRAPRGRAPRRTPPGATTVAAAGAAGPGVGEVRTDRARVLPVGAGRRAADGARQAGVPGPPRRRPGPGGGRAGGAGAVRDGPPAAGPGGASRQHRPGGDVQALGRRTLNPASARASLTEAMVSVPKWNTLAASRASAPASAACTKCAVLPAPPLAISGTCTWARTSRSIGRSNPSVVPSASIEFSRTSPTPRSWARRTHSRASRPVPWRPPWVVTSYPEGVAAPSRVRRASTDSTSTWEPNCSETSAISSGRAIAAVFTPTLSAPARSRV